MVEHAAASAFTEKEQARALTLERLRAVTPWERAAASLAASHHLVHLLAARVPEGAPVALFAPTPLELSDEPALPALALRHPVAFPIVHDGRVEFRKAPYDDLAAHTSKVREPPLDAPPVIPRAVVVPGRAFDRHGTRLGRGKGFYDRGLATLPPETLLVGYCFERQVLERIPALAHDVLMHWLVTEEGALDVSRGRAGRQRKD